MLPTLRVPIQPQDLPWCGPGPPLWSIGMSSDCPFQAGPHRVLAPGVALRLPSQKRGESTFQREHGTDSHNPNSHEIDLVS